MNALPLLSFLLIVSCAVTRAGAAEPLLVQDSGKAAPVKLVRTYHDVLAQIPPDFRGTKPKAWTQIQRESVNDALREALINHQTPGRLLLKVADIADWNGWTFYANVPNAEGYPIRVFGKFTDEWKARFSTLKKGDTVVLEGVLTSTTYRSLWNKFTLSICLKDCTFTKVAGSGEPGIAL
jgi:hypothetical protein